MTLSKVFQYLASVNRRLLVPIELWHQEKKKMESYVKKKAMLLRELRRLRGTIVQLNNLMKTIIGII